MTTRGVRYLLPARQDPYEAASARAETAFEASCLPPVRMPHTPEPASGKCSAAADLLLAVERKDVQVTVDWKPQSFVADAMRKARRTAGVHTPRTRAHQPDSPPPASHLLQARAMIRPRCVIGTPLGSAPPSSNLMHLRFASPKRLDALGQVLPAPAALSQSTKAMGLEDVSDAGACVLAFEQTQFMAPQHLPAWSAAEVVAGTGAAQCHFTHERDDAVLAALKRELDVWPHHIQVGPSSCPSASADLVSAVLGSVMQAADGDGEKSQTDEQQCEPMACMPACIAAEQPLAPDAAHGAARLSLAAQLTSAAVDMCGDHVTPPALSPEFAEDASDAERLAANADPHERACAVLRHMNAPDDDTDAVGDAPQKATPDMLQLYATPAGSAGIDILILEPPAPDGLLLTGGTAAVCADTVASLLALARHNPSAEAATRAASTSALPELAAPQLWHALVVAPTIAMPDTEVATLRVPSVHNPPSACVAATLRAAATTQAPAVASGGAALELAMRWGRDMAPARTPTAQAARKLATTPVVMPVQPVGEAAGVTLLEFGEDDDVPMEDGTDAAALPVQPSGDKPAQPPAPAATGTPVTPAAPPAAVAPASKKAAAVKLKLRPGQAVTKSASGAGEAPKVFGARTSVESELAFLIKAMARTKEAPGVRVQETQLELPTVPHVACWRALRAAARDVAHAHVESHSSDDAALVLDDNWGGSGAPNLDALQSRLRQLVAMHGDGTDARGGVSHVAAVACCYTLHAAAAALLHCGLRVGAAYLTHALRCVPALDSAPLSNFTRGVAIELTAAAERVMAKPDDDHPKLTALRRSLQVCDALAPGAKAAVIADGRAMFTLAHVVVAAGLRVHQLVRDGAAAAAGDLPARVAEAARMCDVLLLTYDQLVACVPALVACGVANVVLYTPSPSNTAGSGSAPHAVSALLPGFRGTVHVFAMRVPSDSPPADAVQHEAAPEPEALGMMDLPQPPVAPAPALHAPDRTVDAASQHCRLVVALNARASIWSELPALRDGVLRLEGKCAASVAERHLGDLMPHGGESADMRPLDAVLSTPDALALGACRRVTALRIMRRSDEVDGLASMTTIHPARLAAGLTAWSAACPGGLILVITLPGNDQHAARIGAGVACLAGASAAASVRLRLCMVTNDADAKDAVLWALTTLSGITAAPPSAAFELAPPHLVPLPERASPGEMVLCACPGITPLCAHALLSSGISLSALLRQDVVPHATALVDAAARGGCVMPELVAHSLHVWRTAVIAGPAPMPPSVAAPPAALYAPPPIVHAAPNYGHAAGPWAEAPPVQQQQMYEQPQRPAMQQDMYEHCQPQRPAPEVRTEFDDDPEMRALFEEPGPYMASQQLLHPPPPHHSRPSAGGIGIGNVRMLLPPLGVSSMHGNSFMGGAGQRMHPPINPRSTGSTSSLSDETARFLADMDGGAPGGQRPSALLLGTQPRGPPLVRQTAPPPRAPGGSGRGTALEAHRFNRPDATPVQATKRARLGDATAARPHSPDSSGSAFQMQHHHHYGLDPAVSAPSAPLGAGMHPSGAGVPGLRPSPAADKQKLSDIMNKLKGTGRRGWRSSKR